MKMNSIRLSLIVYFVLLLTFAMSAVAWLSFRLTAASLRDRQGDAHDLIVSQCYAQVAIARAEVDHRILRQAQNMARSTRSVPVHAEAWFAVPIICSPGLLSPHFANAIFLAEGLHSKVSPFVQPVLQPRLAVIEDAEDHVPFPDRNIAQEYFQTYNGRGQPMQNSEVLQPGEFTLSEQVRSTSELLMEQFDTIGLEDGTRVRRVTLMAPVPRYNPGVIVPWVWDRMPPPWNPFRIPLGPIAKNVPKGPSTTPFPKGPAKGIPPSSFRDRWLAQVRAPFQSPSQVTNMFVQYGADLGLTDAKIRAYETERDEKLANLNTAIENELGVLRSRMIGVGLVALVSLVLGALGIVWVGLSPLTRMSEAVRHVSPRNFALDLDPKTLPGELQPIAERIAEMLKHLQMAFEREKQASADISHELRTPVAALMTTLEVGLRKSRSGEEYREILEECKICGQHMYKLVERLLALARLDAGVDPYRPRATDICDLALECADIIRPLAKARGLKLKLDLPEPMVTMTDPEKLQEVLINLLHNAVEYNNDLGSIELSMTQDANHVHITVRDTGIGIEPDALDHIFERFYRADASRHADTPHAGLGLSIVKSYVELMRGSIRVESSAAGTAFHLTLPIVEPATPRESGITELARVG